MSTFSDENYWGHSKAAASGPGRIAGAVSGRVRVGWTTSSQAFLPVTQCGMPEEMS
ncbi:hypothetical protein ACFU46_24570 [Streptomyces griseoincarnatus]